MLHGHRRNVKIQANCKLNELKSSSFRNSIKRFVYVSESFSLSWHPYFSKKMSSMTRFYRTRWFATSMVAVETMLTKITIWSPYFDIIVL